MFQKAMQHRWARLAMGVFGTFLYAAAVNLFIVPQHLYSGGLLGLCQVIRTVLSTYCGLTVTSFDLAGVLYFILNIPVFILAWRGLGKRFVVNTIVCTVFSSLFLAVIAAPAVPIIEDTLTSCLVAGIVGGFGCGLILTCGCSTGGLDVIGLYLSKKGGNFTVGKFSISFNAVLFAACLLLFDVATVIYSIIFIVFDSLFVDRVHQQNITEQVLIFTKHKDPDLPRFIMEELERGVTFWEGQGGYTGDDVRVLCVCVSKYEVESLETAVRQLDPNAFFMVQEGVRVGGNFERKLS
ncbi:MAG: YitT family protein [Clostridiales bacterium]|nr:YitT family protein [Clostridiales bacterium]